MNVVTFDKREHDKVGVDDIANTVAASDHIHGSASNESDDMLTDKHDRRTQISNCEEDTNSQSGISSICDDVWSEKPEKPSPEVVRCSIVNVGDHECQSPNVPFAKRYPLGELALALQQQETKMCQDHEAASGDAARPLSLIIRHAMSGEDLMLVQARPTDTVGHIIEAVLRTKREVGVAFQVVLKSEVLDSRVQLSQAGIADGDVLSIIVSPLRCITTSFDGTARVRYLQSGVQLLIELGTPVRSAALAPGGSTLLLVAANGAGSLWCAETGVLLRELAEEVLSCAFAADGQTFVGASDGYSARVWCAETGQCLKTLTGHTHDVKTAEFSHDGNLIATASSDHSARVFDARSGTCLLTLGGHSDALRIATFSPDDSLVATASIDAHVRIWSATTGECLHVLHAHTKTVHCLSFSQDGRKLLTASLDGTLCLWKTEGGKFLLHVPLDNNIVKTAGFTPDGTKLLVASGNNFVSLFSVDTGECCLKFFGHEDWVRTASFSPDGMLVVSASYDGTARVWNAANGECLQTLLGHTGAVVSAEIVPT